MYDITEIKKLMDVADLAGLDLGSAADLSYERLAEIYNGCGPEWLRPAARKKLTKHLAIFGPAFVVHDTDFTLADGSTWAFAQANDRLEANCLKLANFRYQGWLNWRRHAARAGAIETASLCRRFGWKSYIKACGH